MQADDVRLSHGRTRYLTAGSGPPVILLHGVGFLDGGDSWLRNIDALAGSFRVLAPDLVGWGPGDQLEQGYSFAYLVDFVREFQDALGIDRAHVVGHSMGGWVASLLAYESPHRVDRLVLVASGGLATRQLATMTGWTPPGPAEIDDRAQRLARDPAELAAELLPRTRDTERVERYRRILEHMSDPETRDRYNTRRRLPYVTSPTLVLWGTADPVNDVALATETHDLLPGARLELLDGIGHHPPTEAPDHFNTLVTDFLTA